MAAGRPATLLSEGATKFDRPGVTDAEQRRTSQLAITGLLAPTSSGGTVVTSVFPAPRRPRGGRRRAARRPRPRRRPRPVDLQVDQGQVDSGALKRVARANLAARRAATPRRRHRGALRRRQPVGATCRSATTPRRAGCWSSPMVLLGGLVTSLTVRRRRFWVTAHARRRRGPVRSWSSAGWPAPTARVTARSSTGLRATGRWTRPTDTQREEAVCSSRSTATGCSWPRRRLRARDGAARRRVRARAPRTRPARSPVADGRCRRSAPRPASGSGRR